MNPRSIAIRRGEKFYSSGKPCSRGHFDRRYSSSGNCVECIKLANTRMAYERRAQRIAYNSRMSQDPRLVSLVVDSRAHDLFTTLAEIVSREMIDAEDNLRAYLQTTLSMLPPAPVRLLQGRTGCSITKVELAMIPKREDGSLALDPDGYEMRVHFGKGFARENGEVCIDGLWYFVQDLVEVHEGRRVLANPLAD